MLSYNGFDVTIEYSKTHEGENVSRIIGELGEIIFDKINELSYYSLRLYEKAAETYHAHEDKSNMADEIKAFVKVCNGDALSGERLFSVTEKTMAAVDDIYRSLGIKFD